LILSENGRCWSQVSLTPRPQNPATRRRGHHAGTLRFLPGLSSLGANTKKLYWRLLRPIPLGARAGFSCSVSRPRAVCQLIQQFKEMRLGGDSRRCLGPTADDDSWPWRKKLAALTTAIRGFLDIESRRRKRPVRNRGRHCHLAADRPGRATTSRRGRGTGCRRPAASRSTSGARDREERTEGRIGQRHPCAHWLVDIEVRARRAGCRQKSKSNSSKIPRRDIVYRSRFVKSPFDRGKHCGPRAGLCILRTCGKRVRRRRLGTRELDLKNGRGRSAMSWGSGEFANLGPTIRDSQVVAGAHPNGKRPWLLCCLYPRPE